MEWVASSLHAWLGLQSIQCYYQQHKWARAFRWKTKSAFCACAITFRFYSTTYHVLYPLYDGVPPTMFCTHFTTLYHPPCSVLTLRRCTTHHVLSSLHDAV